MSEATTSAGAARVLLEIENLGVAGGAPFLLMLDDERRYVLAQKIGDAYQPVSRAVAMGDMTEWALKALGGDKRALAHPRLVVALSLVLLGAIAEGALIKAGRI